MLEMKENEDNDHKSKKGSSESNVDAYSLRASII